MGVLIRSERKNDYKEIKKINDLAFGQENEGKMVEAFRKTADYNSQLSLVAVAKDTIVGHILFYPIKIKNTGPYYLWNLRQFFQNIKIRELEASW